MRNFFLLCAVVFAFACKKTVQVNPTTTTTPVIPQVQGPRVYPVNTLDSFSAINKTTSWYNTTIGMTELFSVQQSLYWGFELLPNGSLMPYNTGTTSTWNASKNYYWNDLGTYLYYDFTGDGNKDLWAYYWKNPWPTNAKGLHLFSEYALNPNSYNLQSGLTQVRKCVIADMDNDSKKDIVLFSSGYDGMPFPGDSLGIFYPKDLKYQYLTQDIGYFHGGATGDINNDGMIDIIGYSGGSAVIPTHPTCYMNKGNRNYQLTNQIFQNFSPGNDNYYTVELFDMNKDNKLDLFLGSSKTLRLIPFSNGVFDRKNAQDFAVDDNLEIMDIAFLDFNFDGNIDVLTMSNLKNYNGWGLRLYINENNSFKEKTKEYFDVVEGSGNGAWIKWIRIFDIDKDGDLDVVGDGLFGDLKGTSGRIIYWENNSGKFKFVYK